MSNFNVLDSIIGFFSPKWGFERRAWRNGYDSAGFDRLNSNWSPVDGMGEQINQGYRDIILRRARDLERNSDLTESQILAFERNVVGCGFKLQAKITKDDGQEDDILNQEIEKLFKNWAKVGNCDLSGQFSFTDIQRMVLRRLIVDGGILIILSWTKTGLKLQLREVDEIDSSVYITSYKQNSNRVINGIEFDQYNKPVAYYLKNISPDGFYSGDAKRINADRVIFLYQKTRPSQLREISKLKTTAERVKNINEYIEAVSVKERILACLSVFIKKGTPTTNALGRGATVDSKSGYYQKTMAPGMVTELQPGDDVQAVNPSGQASNAKEFISTQQRISGAGLGLSYEVAARDMSQVNYSSARQGLLEDQRTYLMLQQYIREHFLEKIYDEWILNQILSKKLEISRFFLEKEKYIEHKWLAPGWSWIDPQKEVKANVAALETNQTTLQQICAEKGEDWKDVIKQRVKEKQLEQQLQGLGEANNG